MTEDTQVQARRDPLVEHVVPLLAKAMGTTQNTEELWAYLQERVEAECRRMEDDAVRDALEPLRDRFSIRRSLGSQRPWRSRPSRTKPRSRSKSRVGALANVAQHAHADHGALPVEADSLGQAEAARRPARDVDIRRDRRLTTRWPAAAVECDGGSGPIFWSSRAAAGMLM